MGFGLMKDIKGHIVNERSWMKGVLEPFSEINSTGIIAYQVFSVCMLFRYWLEYKNYIQYTKDPEITSFTG